MQVMSTPICFARSWINAVPFGSPSCSPDGEPSPDRAAHIAALLRNVRLFANGIRPISSANSVAGGRMAVDVLIVDDDADLRAPLGELLRDEGYLVEELGSA